MPRSGMLIFDGITPVATYMMASTAMNVAEAMEQGKIELEQYAKYNAPWADQTGDARNGLMASVDFDAGEIVLSLAHSVDYGIWLELIQDGTFAILMPTIEALAPKIFRDAGAVVTNTSGAF